MTEELGDNRLPNKLSFDELAAKVISAPFHRWLNLRLVALNERDVVIEMPWRDEIVANPSVGYAHGGVLATLIDLTADYAIAAKLGRGVPTVDMRVDFHRPALSGPLRITGRVIKLGRTLATAEAWVADPAGKLLASGRATFIVAS